jgi:SIR2-like domain
MQFVKDGPDLPNALLQLHEEGSVVFFCGAGISYPAGLPGFRSLVDKTYAGLHTSPDPTEEEAIKRKQLDVTLDLLEHRIAGGRSTVRRAIAGALRPNLRARNATRTHKALLTLARDRKNSSRLVTTNFDRIFEAVMRDRAFRVPIYQAPMLPIPKGSKWNGLVYLHGLLPQAMDDVGLNRLVLSSGDFGLAYLTERWASRFVGELLRNYVVCFVGYSIDDPVIRYMMDALAADRMLGEATQPAYAFAAYTAGCRDEAEREWLSKRVTPILYEVAAGSHDHALLHTTLHVWSDTHRDGVNGKEQIVVRYALTKPSASTVEDDFAGRLIWALSDSSGLPAKRFADLDPLPSFEWLAPMWDRRFRHADLVRFGVEPAKTIDEKLQFGLIHRPAPYRLSPWMSLANSGLGVTSWDDVMAHLARWLARHTGDPELVLWIAGRGGTPHPFFASLIVDALKRPGPSAAIRKLWDVILARRVRNPRFSPDLYAWFRDLKEAGALNPLLRTRLRDMLRPVVTLTKPVRLALTAEEPRPRATGECIRDIADCNVTLSVEHAHVVLRELGKNEIWIRAVWDLLEEFADLLREALDLMHYLEGADEMNDLSYIHQPSIAEHPQNQHFQEWTTLIDLVRDSWRAVALTDPMRARLEVLRWQRYRYPTFRRLTLFVSQDAGVFSSQQALEWLLQDRAWWFWSSETQREALQLLGHLVSRLSDNDLQKLESAILAGPPREMYRADIADEDWSRVFDETVWLRLAKWRDSGADLLPGGQARLRALTQARPDRAGVPDERREFPFWIGTGGDWRRFSPVPKSFRELPRWLEENPPSEFDRRDNWQELCKGDLRRAAWALIRLSRVGIWPVERWREALQAWSEASLRPRSWLWVASTILQSSDGFILSAAGSLVWWLRQMADEKIEQEEIWLSLVSRVLFVYRGEMEAIVNDPVGQAINHPVGQATEALLHWWYQRELKDQQRLPEHLTEVFTELCDQSVVAYRHGRVLLAQAVITLFRVDSQWTSRCVLPLFDWTAPHGEARLAWEGFLWTPRIYFPLLASLKASFLETAKHYDDLDKHGEQYAAFLTFVALQSQQEFSKQELASAVAALPREGLEKAAQALVSALRGAGTQQREFWENRAVPYLIDLWPKSRHISTQAISRSFGELCIAAGDSFPAAYDIVRVWLQRLKRPDYLVHLLDTSGLCTKYPDVSLALLDTTVGEIAEWAPRELPGCLRQIETASPRLVGDPRFKRLFDYARQKGLI